MISLTQESTNFTEVSVGDLSFWFSYSTMIGFAVPGVGRVTCENVWSSTTGKHLNQIPALYDRISLDLFRLCETELNKFFDGEGTRQGLEYRLKRILRVK